SWLYTVVSPTRWPRARSSAWRSWALRKPSASSSTAESARFWGVDLGRLGSGRPATVLMGRTVVAMGTLPDYGDLSETIPSNEAEEERNESHGWARPRGGEGGAERERSCP